MGSLVLNNVSKRFGGLFAIDNVSVSFSAGSITSIIGPNGAGKTTLFNLITGGESVSSGSITFNGKKISGYKPNVIHNIGISRTFQNIRLFNTMTVLENILVGAYFTQNKAPKLRGKAFSTNDQDIITKAEECLDLVGLKGQSQELAASLPYGAQRKLEIARALVSTPEILLLDEPAAGMNSREANDLKKLIVSLLNRFVKTIIVIEHNMKFVMSISEQIIVLDSGSKIAEGKPENIANNPRVVEAYLGANFEEEGLPEEGRMDA